MEGLAKKAEQTLFHRPVQMLNQVKRACWEEVIRSESCRFGADWVLKAFPPVQVWNTLLQRRGLAAIPATAFPWVDEELVSTKDLSMEQ